MREEKMCFKSGKSQKNQRKPRSKKTHLKLWAARGGKFPLPFPMAQGNRQPKMEGMEIFPREFYAPEISEKFKKYFQEIFPQKFLCKAAQPEGNSTYCDPLLIETTGVRIRRSPIQRTELAFCALLAQKKTAGFLPFILQIRCFFWSKEILPQKGIKSVCKKPQKLLNNKEEADC